MTYIVALTGGIGSGKSTISKEFADLGVPIIDSDVISKEIFYFDHNIQNSLRDHFGLHILNSDNSLSRKKLRKIVFKNEIEKNWLNNLFHPLIYQKIKNRLRSVFFRNTNYLLWVSPLLIENNLETLADRTLVVDSSAEEQLKRIIFRDKVPIQEAENIIFHQTSRINRLNKADDVIFNETKKDLISIRDNVRILHKKYLFLSTYKKNFLKLK